MLAIGGGFVSAAFVAVLTYNIFWLRGAYMTICEYSNVAHETFVARSHGREKDMNVGMEVRLVIIFKH